jgi:Flp pilus assembly protein CpaB
MGRTRSALGRWRGRRPRRYWLVTMLAAAAAAALTMGVVGRAQTALEGLGTLVPVAVATRALEPGDAVGADDVTWRDLPSALLADDRVDHDPVGRTVTDLVVAGEAFVESRLAPDGPGGRSSAGRPGTRAIAVPMHPPPEGFAPGDRVDLLDLDGWLARDAVVVDVGEQSLTVAVTEDEAPAVARAVVDGVVTPALVSPG